MKLVSGKRASRVFASFTVSPSRVINCRIRVEHRLFAFITQNWRGKPLVSHQVIVQLIANTRTEAGLTVACRIDTGAYQKGIKVSDDEMDALNIQLANFHGEWNYTFTPRQPDT